MEEADTNKSKITDSAYSTSCNSRSQRSSGSSKSRNSGSSNSSGYGGNASSQITTVSQQPNSKRNKDKKKKGSKVLPPTYIERLKEAEEGSSTEEVIGIQQDESDSGKVENASRLPELVFGANSSHHNEVLQMALNQSFSLAQKLNSSPEEPPIASEVGDEKEEIPSSSSVSSPTVQDKTSHPKEEFTATISMNDGTVKYTSSGITDVLGFPEDMWIGRSITDFVQVKDRAAFASRITSGVAIPQVDKDCGRRSPFFCGLRCYRGLQKSGFGVKDKLVQYKPCRLILTFRGHISDPFPEETKSEKNATSNANAPSSKEQTHIYLVLTVNPIRSAFTYPEEEITRQEFEECFGIRLLASTHLSEVGPGCVPYLGYLPQDMLGRSVLEFYHPEDMPLMKDVYESVVKEQGATFLSKPSRFRTQNGGYLLLETQWSSFSNPFSRKLEFIIAQHRVLKGPPNPDVFAAPPQGDAAAQISEEVLKESKIIQEEIQAKLNELMAATPENSKKRNLSKCCKDLASSMEETKKQDLYLEVPTEQKTFSERDSVMLGEISPHHEYYDSKSSTETPPSYNQLNYNDNIQRFFESKPKTTMSTESSKDKNGSNGKNSPEQDSSLGSADSGSGGGSGEMTGSHDSAASSSRNSFAQPMLTEDLLTRHNQNMEKRFVQNYRDQTKREKHHKAPAAAHTNHGLKRLGPILRESDSFKGIKHFTVDNQGNTAPDPSTGPTAPAPGSDANELNVGVAVVTSTTAACTGSTTTTTMPQSLTTTLASIYQNSSSSVWPPFSVTVTPLQSSSVVGPFSSYPLVGPAAPHMMPMYFMGLGHPDHPGSRNPFIPSTAYMPAAPSPHIQLVYHPQSLMYTPLPILQPTSTMLPSSLFPPGACLPTEPMRSNQMQAQASALSGLNQTPQHGQQQQPLQQNHILQPQSQQPPPPSQQWNQQLPKPPNAEFQRPSSQATSVKAEPGSALGSVASASRRALSVSSNKNKPLSPCDNLSPDEDKAMEDSTQCREQRGDESSFYSSLGSCPCDNSDESMKSFKDTQHDESNFMSQSSDSNAEPPPRPARQDKPPWMENVNMTREEVLNYQVEPKSLKEVVDADRLWLEKRGQPNTVNDQLRQLCQENGVTEIMEESSSSEDQLNSNILRLQKPKKKPGSRSQSLFYGEDAPMIPFTKVAS